MDMTILENTLKAQKENRYMWGMTYDLITQEHIQALLDGKQLAFDDGEYMHYLSMKEPK